MADGQRKGRSSRMSRALGIPVPAASASAIGTSDQPSLSGYDQSWAVLIGINRYTHCSTLESAVRDVESVSEALQQLGFPSQNIVSLVDGNATRSTILDVLSVDLPQRVGPEDRLLVYFAGHSQVHALPTGRKVGYFMPVDGDPQRLASSCIPMSEIRHWNEGLPAKHILYVLDCCYAGLATSRAAVPRDWGNENVLRRLLRSRARQVIAASGAGHKAYEQSGKGFLTQSFLEGILGAADVTRRGFITGFDLGHYVTSRCAQLSEGQQSPHYENLEGDGQFIANLPSRNRHAASNKSGGNPSIALQAVSGDLLFRKKEYWFTLGLELWNQEEPSPKWAIFALILLQFGRTTGQLAEIERVRIRLSAFARQLKGKEPGVPSHPSRSELLFSIAQDYAEDGELEKSADLLDELLGCKADELESASFWWNCPTGKMENLRCSVLTGQVARGQLTSATRTVAGVERFCKLVERKGPPEMRWSVSELFIEQLCKMNKIDRALQHARWMRSRGYAPTNYSTTIARISAALFTSRRWDGYFKFLKTSAANCEDPSDEAHLWIGPLQSSDGPVPKVQAFKLHNAIQVILNKIPAPLDQAQQWARCAEGYARHGVGPLYSKSAEEAVRLLAQAERNVTKKKQREADFRAKTLKVMVPLTRAHLAAGEQALAQTLLRRVLKTSRQLLNRNKGRAVVDADVIRLLVQMDERASAEALYAECRRESIYVGLAAAYAERGMFSDIKRLYDQAVVPASKQYLLFEIYEAFKSLERPK